MVLYMTMVPFINPLMILIDYLFRTGYNLTTPARHPM
jgi:hypothetical protein